MYQLEILGGIVLEGPEGPLSGYAAQSRQLALLALLGAAGDKGCSRDKLCAYLWPDADDASAHHSLTDAVYRLRKSLGRDAILGRGVTLKLNPDVIRCDVTAFEAALAEDDLETAAELYRGPLLDGFHLRESSEFEHWRDGEARRLGSMFEGLLETLATRAESVGDHARAVGWWRRLAEHDPFNSRTAVRLMEAQANAGDPANAVMYAREHAELLRSELGVEPPGEVVDLAERLRRARPTADSGERRPGVSKVPRLPVATSGAGETTPPVGGRRWLVVGLPVVVVGIGVAVWLGTRGTPDGGGPRAGGSEGVIAAQTEGDEPDRLAVVPLEDLLRDPEVEVWGHFAADAMGNAIDRTGVIVVLPADKVREAVRSIPGDVSATSVARRLRASHAVAGTVARTGDRVRFQVELLDVRGGERLVALEPVVGAVDSVEAAVARLSQAAAAAAVAFLDPEAALWGAPAVADQSVPVRLDAFRHYLRGWELGCQFRLEEANDAMDQALAVDPQSVRVLFSKGVVLGNWGRNEEADSIFSQLASRRDLMTRVERAAHDYWIAYLHGDALGTLSAIEEAYRLSPTSMGYVAGLEMNQQRRHQEALTRLLAQDHDGLCMREWAFWWTVMAGTYHLLGRYEEELDLVQRGLERFPDHVALVATEAVALAAMGQLDAVDSLLDAMVFLPSQPGFGDANIQLVNVALELRAHGHLEAAARAFARSMKGYRALPPDQYRHQRGLAFYYAGRLSDADTLSAALLETNPESVSRNGLRGVVLAQLGRRAEALVIDRWLEAVPERPGLRGSNRMWRARIAAGLGDLEAAVRHFRDALDHRAGYGTWVHREPAFDNMWGYRPWEALLAPR
jgi:DNA-binding SARP family transcriptional activator/tetratricopeptide (TPR) repeat protein